MRYLEEEDDWMRRFRKVFSYKVLLILIFSILVFSRYLDLPFAMVIVFGESMSPTLNIGDMVFLVKSEYSVGDIVLWCSGFTCILHRVISINDETVVTKGDANDIPDVPVPKEMIKYKAILHIPWYLWIPILALIVFLIYRYEG